MNLGTERGEDTYCQVAKADCVPSAVPRTGAPDRHAPRASTGRDGACGFLPMLTDPRATPSE